jgi:hypothetical protein
MTTLTQITDHKTAAKNRLIDQYKEKVNIEAIIDIYADMIQEVEGLLFDLLNNRSLSTASGKQLDLLGEILDEARSGLDDSTYKVRLLNKVSQINSEGTAEDLINIYKILMQADSIQYGELYPASVVLFAFGATPIGTISEIKKSLLSAKPAGVEVQAINVPTTFLSFVGDPDGFGLGDLGDADLGGHLAAII